MVLFTYSAILKYIVICGRGKMDVTMALHLKYKNKIHIAREFFTPWLSY